MNLLDELLKRISTKGDIGIASLGFVLGYLLDLKIAAAGLTPGVAGALGLAAAVGLKNTMEGVRSFFSESRAQSRKELESSVAKVQQLSDELGNSYPHVTRLYKRVRVDCELWHKGLVGRDVLQRTVENFVQEYRAFGPGGDREKTSPEPVVVIGSNK